MTVDRSPTPRSKQKHIPMHFCRLSSQPLLLAPCQKPFAQSRSFAKGEWILHGCWGCRGRLSRHSHDGRVSAFPMKVLATDWCSAERERGVPLCLGAHVDHPDNVSRWQAAAAAAHRVADHSCAAGAAIPWAGWPADKVQAGLLRQVRPHSRAPVTAPDLNLCSACACTPHNTTLSVLSIGSGLHAQHTQLNSSSSCRTEVEHAHVQSHHTKAGGR